MLKITMEIAQRIIDLYCQGVKVKTLAEQFKICQSNVTNIIRGISWKNCMHLVICRH